MPNGNLLVYVAHPIFVRHLNFQDDVKVPADVRILVGRHPLVAQNDRHTRCQDSAFGACLSYPSAVKVIDQYTVKSQECLGKSNGNGRKQIVPRTLK